MVTFFVAIARHLGGVEEWLVRRRSWEFRWTCAYWTRQGFGPGIRRYADGGRWHSRWEDGTPLICACTFGIGRDRVEAT